MRKNSVTQCSWAHWSLCGEYRGNSSSGWDGFALGETDLPDVDSLDETSVNSEPNWGLSCKGATKPKELKWGHDRSFWPRCFSGLPDLKSPSIFLSFSLNKNFSRWLIFSCLFYKKYRFSNLLLVIVDGLYWKIRLATQISKSERMQIYKNRDVSLVQLNKLIDKDIYKSALEICVNKQTDSIINNNTLTKSLRICA